MDNLKLIVRGKEFFVKGMAYSPFPLGVKDKKGDYGGGGYCSAKQTIFGEQKSACFGSDFIDGVPAEAERKPSGPPGPWWGEVWRRDVAIMKKLGVNTIRLYNMNPITATYIKKFPNDFKLTAPGRAAQHH